VRCCGRPDAPGLRPAEGLLPFLGCEAVPLDCNGFAGFDFRLFRFMAGPDNATPACANRAADWQG